MALLLILIAICLAFVVAMFFSLDKIKNNEMQSPPAIQSSNKIESAIPEEPARFPPASGIDRQYQNIHVDMKERHPVLEYQMATSRGVVPATLGDPIRIPDVAGPAGLYGDRSRVYDALVIRPQARPPGPYPGMPIGVPVPAGALKMTADYGYGFSGPGGYPFVGSVDAYAPFRDVNTQFRQVGILTSSRGHDKNEILNLFARPIAPGQDLWEYQVQDKNGFIIKLERTKYLEDGDEVNHVIGKHGLGPWRAHIFVQNRYVWV